MNNINRDHIRGWCLKSFENSVQFIKDAKLLLENESYGHSYSLAVLGLEELSKALLVFDVLVGVWDFNNPHEINFIKQQLKDHENKHLIAVNTIISNLLIQWYEETALKDFFEELRQKFLKNEISEIAFQDKLVNLIMDDEENESANIFITFLEFAIKVYEKPNLIENLKQKGFYVDFKFKKGEVTGPFSFSKFWVEERIESIETVVTYYGEVFKLLSDRKLQNKYIKPLYNLFENLFKTNS